MLHNFCIVSIYQRCCSASLIFLFKSIVMTPSSSVMMVNVSLRMQDVTHCLNAMISRTNKIVVSAIPIVSCFQLCVVLRPQCTEVYHSLIRKFNRLMYSRFMQTSKIVEHVTDIAMCLIQVKNQTATEMNTSTRHHRNGLTAPHGGHPLKYVPCVTSQINQIKTCKNVTPNIFVHIKAGCASQQWKWFMHISFKQ